MSQTLATRASVSAVRTIDSAAGPVHVVQTREDAARLWAWCQDRANGVLGFDAETNAVDPFAAGYVLRTVQVADAHEAWVIQAQRPEILAADVVATVVHSHARWVAHYAENDLRFVERAHPGSLRLGQIATHLADTQVAMAHHDPRTITSNDTFTANGVKLARAARLADCLSREFDTDIWHQADAALCALFAELAPKGQRSKQASKAWGFANIDQDNEIYLRYAAMDAIGCARLFAHCRAALTQRGIWSEVCRDMRRQWHIDQMTFRGLAVDAQYTRWIGRELAAAEAAQQPLLAFYGVAPSAMGPTIGAAMTALARTSTRTSRKTGAASWDKEALAPIANDAGDPAAAELVRGIQTVRKASKMTSTYVKPALAAVEHGDGRVHCRMRNIGAIHGRMTASDPPLQQQPKRVDTRIRPMYVAGPGNVFVSADFRQGEPRVMAARSGDKQLKFDILEGDLNSAIAAETYGNAFVIKQAKNTNTVHYRMRQAAKAGFLGRCYGAGAAKLSEVLTISVPAARAALDRWDARYPDLARHTARLNRLPYITFDCGRIAPLWDRYLAYADGSLHCGSKPSRLGLNYDTCGHQRDLFCIAIDRVIDWGWSWSLAFLLHDEILCCVPIDRANECKHMLESAMTMEYMGMPFEAEATIEGQSWMPRPAAFDASILEEIEL